MCTHTHVHSNTTGIHAWCLRPMMYIVSGAISASAFWFCQLGMRQHYYLGRLFHKRYSTELNASYLFDNYTRTQIYVRSTDVDRTLMSAQCQLASLFEPNSTQVGRGGRGESMVGQRDGRERGRWREGGKRREYGGTERWKGEGEVEGGGEAERQRRERVEGMVGREGGKIGIIASVHFCNNRHLSLDFLG